MTDESKERRSIRQIQAEDHKDYFAGNITVRTNFFDFRITIGDVKTQTDGEQVLVTNATVIMSPQHAKVFSMLLAQKVAAYEAGYGEIIVPSRVAEFRNVVN